MLQLADIIKARRHAHHTYEDDQRANIVVKDSITVMPCLRQVRAHIYRTSRIKFTGAITSHINTLKPNLKNKEVWLDMCVDKQVRAQVQ